MENLKNYLEKKEQEAEGEFEKAITAEQQGSAFSARYALTDVLIKLEETQREMLEKIADYIKTLREAIDKNNRWGKEHFYRIIVGMLIAYRIIFGKEGYEEITNSEPGNLYGGVDLEKLKKVLEDLR